MAWLRSEKTKVNRAWRLNFITARLKSCAVLKRLTNTKRWISKRLSISNIGFWKRQNCNGCRPKKNWIVRFTLSSVPVPESVRAALVDNVGPFQPFLEVVNAVENESIYDIRQSAERLLLGESAINRATLRALAGAAQLQ